MASVIFRASHVPRFLAMALLALCLALPPLVPGAQARAPRADAAPPVAVAYHLTALYTQGPAAGTALEASVIGTRAASGVLVATLTTTQGITATVTGPLTGTTALLTVTGKAGAAVLRGGVAGSGRYAGSIAGGAAGSWLLVAEPLARSYQFAANVRSGPDTGTVLSGTLAASAEPSGRFDGVLALDDGTSLVATGSAVSGNLEVSIYLPTRRAIIGVAPRATETILGTPYTLFTGTFAGPSSGDSGTWSVSQGT